MNYQLVEFRIKRIKPRCDLLLHALYSLTTVPVLITDSEMKAMVKGHCT